eukprot:6515790-Pyramimonas_sp.AAC.1
MICFLLLVCVQDIQLRLNRTIAAREASSGATGTSTTGTVNTQSDNTAGDDPTRGASEKKRSYVRICNSCLLSWQAPESTDVGQPCGSLSAGNIRRIF